MHHLLIQGLSFLKAHRAWAGPWLGLAACFEALVVIGALTPLTPLLVMVGAAIGAGVLSPWVLIWTTAGCGLGSWISYEAGRRARFETNRLGWIPARARETADGLFKRYGLFAVAIGRFLGPAASITPFLAGVAAMPRSRFLMATLATSLIWPIAIASLGYLAARSLLG